MASVRMHGRRRETPRQHRAVQRPTQQRVRERVSVEGEGWGWGEEGETETATEGEDEGEGGGRVWSVECGVWSVECGVGSVEGEGSVGGGGEGGPHRAWCGIIA